VSLAARTLVLREFAQAAGAGSGNQVLLVLDRGGWRERLILGGAA
jgi:hypothetical protein